MESFNNSGNNSGNNKRTIALGMPPLPPTSQRKEGQSSQHPNIPPRKLKRTLTRRRYNETFRLKQISRIMQLEETLKSLEADLERDFEMKCYWKRQHYLFQVENDVLKQKFGLCSLEIESKEAEYVELKKEKDELNEVYVEQHQKYEELMKGYMANAQFMDMVGQSGFPTYNFM